MRDNNEEINIKETPKKLSEKMESLKIEKIEQIKTRMIESGETLPSEEELDKLVTVKCLENLELINEQGEKIEKNIFILMVQQPNGEIQIDFYDEEQQLIAREQNFEGKSRILPAEKYAFWKLDDKIKNWEKDEDEKEKTLAEAKTIEEMKKQEMAKEQQEKANEQVDMQGPHLNATVVSRLSGPKINLNDWVDNVTLGKKVGLEGAYIQFVDINKLKELDIPGFKAPAELGQRFMPIVISENGTANIVGEDKLKFSTLEGGNATIERNSMNSDGTENQEQGIVTFNIPGTNNAMTIHWDDELGTSSPFYEASFLTRAPDNQGHLDELTNEGHLKKDDKAHLECIWNTEGEYEAIVEVDRLTVTEELAKRYAEIKDYQQYDTEGNPTLDIARARQELEKKAEDMKEATRGSDREGKPSIYGFVKQAQIEKEERNADAKVLGPQNPYMDE